MTSIFVIAEAGVNHNGSLKNAFKLVDIAKNCGVDAIKFQSFIAEDEISKYAKKPNYQKSSLKDKQTQLEMVKKLELSFKNQKKIISYCKKRNIKFISSPFDLKSIEFLYKQNLDIIKIPSSEIDNVPYLEKISKKFKKIILSTGMSNLKDINNALKILKKKTNKISILHCVSAYPTPEEEVNLSLINTLKKKFNLDVGFSDHTKSIFMPGYAILSGAVIIEKHFTISKKLQGPDHKISLNPKELKKMVSHIRYIEKILGNNIKKISKVEKSNFNNVRKSIVANKNIKVGEKFTLKNITTKRPRNGLSPIYWHQLLNKISKNLYKVDEPIKKNEL